MHKRVEQFFNLLTRVAIALEQIACKPHATGQLYNRVSELEQRLSEHVSTRHAKRTKAA